MIELPVKITGMIVTLGMGLFLTAVVLLVIVPIMQAMMDKRKIGWPPIAPIMENLGVAMAIAGLTFRVTEVAAIGVGLALLGAWYGYGKAETHFHPVFEKVMAVAGVVCVGTLA
ncbi:MAG: hypothetical protein OEZ03_17430, partial [Alphaproteobacteria bacterium]|nr:hypothetical protein [Alphaproteobacteria bacterium]